MAYFILWQYLPKASSDFCYICSVFYPWDSIYWVVPLGMRWILFLSLSWFIFCKYFFSSISVAPPTHTLYSIKGLISCLFWGFLGTARWPANLAVSSVTVLILSQNLHQVSQNSGSQYFRHGVVFYTTQPRSVSQDPDAAEVYQSPSGV